MKLFAPFVSAALAVTVFGVTVAEAQTRRYNRNARTIYVQPRSFLDAGKVVPIGSELNYVYIGQYYNPPPFYNQLRPHEFFYPLERPFGY